MRVVYFDCFSGISGDMTLASLVDAGASLDTIKSELNKLKLDPFTIEHHKVVKKGVTATKVDVIIENDKVGTHRHYTDIINLIDESDLSINVKEKSKKIFKKIGIAEGKVHNIPLERVHFHEVGAIDSIVDIIGVCIAIEELGVQELYTSPIPLGTGQIKIDHGIYPIPTPATLEILKGIPIRASQINFEMTTPTGAGIVAALGNGYEGYPSMTVESIGYGAGTKDFPDRPNVLRAIVGEVNEIQLGDNSFHIHEHSEIHQNYQHPQITK